MGPSTERPRRWLAGRSHPTVRTVRSRRNLQRGATPRDRVRVRAAWFLVALVCAGLLAPQASLAARTPGEGELDDVAVAPLDASLEPDVLLRSRPFVIGDSPCPIFCPSAAGEPLTERAARRALGDFLERRGLDDEEIDEAVD